MVAASAARRLAIRLIGLWLVCGPLVAGSELNIEVIGAGPSRTGTQSLFFALRELGYKSSHGHWYLWNPALRRPWKDWLHRGGPLEAALAALAHDGRNATLDVPFHAAYKDLMHRFPRAKVILTQHSSPDDWYRSMTTFTPLYRSYTVWLFLFVKQLRAGFTLREATVGLRMFNEDYIRLLDCDTEAEPFSHEVRQRCIAGYKRVLAEVKREVPPERLLVYNASQGWGPLCAFLGKPVPRIPFPRVDRLRPLDVVARKALLQWTGSLVLCFLCALVARRCLRRGCAGSAELGRQEAKKAA